MRLVPGKPIRTKGCTLGDNRPLVCVPMVEKTKEADANLQNLLKINDEENATAFNSNVDEYWNGLTEEQKLSWNNSKDELVAAIKKVRNLTATQTVYSRLRRQLKDMDKFVSEAKKNGLDVTNENIAAIASYINKISKSQKIQFISNSILTFLCISCMKSCELFLFNV